MPKIAFPLRVKAVAIDLDGTMLDTVEDLAIAVNMMLERIGRPSLDQSLVRNFVGTLVAIGHGELPPAAAATGTPRAVLPVVLAVANPATAPRAVPCGRECTGE